LLIELARRNAGQKKRIRTWRYSWFFRAYPESAFLSGLGDNANTLFNFKRSEFGVQLYHIGFRFGAIKIPLRITIFLCSDMIMVLSA